MKIVEISYNPYKMTTKMFIDEIDVCESSEYDGFKWFIEQETPLQTWIEPIGHLNWRGFVNEISDESNNDEVTIVFSGRDIDFRDLKHAIKTQNDKREKRTKVKYHYEHKKVLDDKQLSKDIDMVVSEIKSDKFAELVKTRTTEGLTNKYNALDKNYSIAKDSEFHIIVAGIFSSGKSTLLNTLIRHDVLPTSFKTCTSKNCRIRHDSTLGRKVSLTGYDAEGNIVVEKRIFEDDVNCKLLFEEISPINSVNEVYSSVATMELGVDLTHLYPKSVSEDKFTIVLIDTPGMGSAKESTDDTNKHEEIAFDAISDERKPMILLCVEAKNYEDKKIGEFMRSVISNSKDDGGFNDRYLFLMNQSDAISYGPKDSADEAKVAFSKYLTDSSKWNIDGDDEELHDLAKDAEKFVPRVFMTSALIAWGIYNGADNYPVEVLKTDPLKRELRSNLNRFVENVTVFEDENLFLSRHCDIPEYRKEEINKKFEEAIENNDKILAAELQCGVVSVEMAIQDYIERYAFPIKVRDLLATFEDVLIDVKSFASGILADMEDAEKELGEKSSEREGVREEKTSAKEKIAALNEAKVRIKTQESELEKIQFDSTELGKATSNFQAEIERDSNIQFIRSHDKVETGQRSRQDVETEIREMVESVKKLFSNTLEKTNEKLVEIKKKHDGQIMEVYNHLQAVIGELEKVGALENGKFKFKDSVLWKMEFADLDSSKFLDQMINTVVDKRKEKQKVDNDKKWEWRYGGGFFKKLISFVMPDEVWETKYYDGSYNIGSLKSSIDNYLNQLDEDSAEMERKFREVLDNSKKRVKELISRLTKELEQYHTDIAEQDKRIKALSGSMGALTKEINKQKKVLSWLNGLEAKIKGE